MLNQAGFICYGRPSDPLENRRGAHAGTDTHTDHPVLPTDSLHAMDQRGSSDGTGRSKRMTKRELEIGRMLYPETDYYKPKARVECLDGPRPCPYVSCQHHLYLDVSSRTGAIKLNFPDLEVWDMNESCALDIADRGGTTLEDVGAIMNLTRERIRQVEVKALAKLEALKDMSSLRDYIDEGPVGKRRLPVLAVVEEDDEDEDEFEEDAAEEIAANDDAPVALEAVAPEFDGLE